MREGGFLFVSLLNEFLEIDEPCFLLDDILLPGPRKNLRGTTFFER